jgi:hypothetical protein
MKRQLHFIFLFFCIVAAQCVSAQGWRARVVLNFGTGITPLASVDYATISFAGGGGYGWSTSSYVLIELTGEGAPGGPFQIAASGRSIWNSQATNYVSVASSMPITGYCDLYSLDGDPAVNQQVSGWIMMFPRLRINDVIEECDHVTLTTDVCSDEVYTWEVSESLSGPFRVIRETYDMSIEISGQDLAAIGLRKYGRKFFRVTGGSNTTSLIEVVDFYPPGPSASFSFTTPACHDGSDAMIKMDIVSSHPSVIDDFIVNVAREADDSRVQQFVLDNTSSLTVEGLRAGNYNIRITNHSSTESYGQCWTEFEVGPIQNPEKVSITSFEVSDYNGYQLTCKEAQDGTIIVHPSGGTGTYSAFLWTPQVSTTPTAFNLQEGSYNIKVKDSNNCWSDEYEQTLSAPEQLSVTLKSTGGKGGFDVSCQNKSDGEITTITTGGVPQYAFKWSTGETTANLTAVDTGTYHLIITDANGCTGSGSLLLRAPDAIDFSIREVSRINCPGDQTGILEVQSLANTIGQVYYSWSSGEAGKEISGKGSGTYSLTVSDEQGCQQTRSKTLDEPPSYSVDITAVSDFNGSPIKCHGEANGRLTSVLRDDNQNIVPAENYSWYRNGNEFLEGGITNSVLDLVPAGIYTVKILYGSLCEAGKTFTLLEPDPVSPVIIPASDYNGVPISCYGASDGSLSVHISGGTGDTYTWLWNSGQRLPTLTGLSAGNYSVTATDINGCPGKAEKVLLQPQPVEALITVLSDYNGQPLTCTNASDARLRGSAKGGTPLFTYIWSTGESSPDLTDIPAGNYTFTAVDANGCSSIAEMHIANPVAVKAEITEASDFHGFGVSCHGAADGFVLAGGSGGTGTYNYDWNGGIHTTALYPRRSAGKYTVQITDQNGCYSIAEKEITEPPQLTLEVSGIKNVACNDGDDGEIRLLPGGGAGDYRYSTSGIEWQAESVMTALNAGRHFLMVQDANGCEQSVFQDLTEPQPLSVVFDDVEPALCGDPRGKVSAHTTGGTGSYRYDWSDTQGLLISDRANIFGLMAGIYTLKVTDDHFCQEIQSVAISSTDGPQVEIAHIIPPTCSYTRDGSALLEVTQGDGPFTFLWTDGQQTSEAVNLPKGNHLVEIRDANQCSVIKSITLIAPDSLEINVVERKQPACNLDCNGKLVVAAKGGSGNYLYQWQGSTGPEHDGLCAGEYNVVATDVNGCIAQRTLSLDEPHALSINLISAKAPNCHNACDAAIAVEASGGTAPIEYMWSTGKSAPLIDSLCAGSYTATIMDANHCVAEKTFVVEAPEEPHLDLGESIMLCEGQTHILDPGNFWESYAWSSNTGFSSEQQRITVAASGHYWLEAATSQGCIALDTFFLQTSRDLLEANFLLATQAMIHDTVVLIDISWPVPENSMWHFPDEMHRLLDYGDIVYGRFDREGPYDISLRATLGECRDEMTKTITILKNEHPAEEGRLGYRPFVKEFTLYPNPNEGMFDVKVTLMETSPIALTIWNTMAAAEVGHFKADGQEEYMMHIDLRPLSAGSYAMRLDHKEGTTYLRFMVR